MSETPNLALPLVAAAQAQKHVTVNEALLLLDALVSLRLESVGETAPPGSPANGDRYGVPAGATGAWAGHAGEVAVRLGGGWVFRPPALGQVGYVADEARLAVFRPGLGWASALAASPNGASLSPAVIEEEVALAGPFVDTVAMIPARALVLAVSVRTVTAVTGAASYDCGLAGEPSKFGGSLGAAAGATNVGVVGPFAVYADTPVRLTANGGDFTGGAVRVAMQVVRFTAPAA
jgi:hypothetical protein